MGNREKGHNEDLPKESKSDSGFNGSVKKCIHYQYVSKFEDGKIVTRCKDCGEVAEPKGTHKKGETIGAPAYGKFASSSPTEKQKILRKRSVADSRKHQDMIHQKNHPDYIP